MKEEINISLKTMGMKSKFANFVRKTLNKYKQPSTYKYNPYNKEVLTPEKKIELFDMFWSEYVEMDSLLLYYKRKRKYKRFVKAEREKRKNGNIVL